MGNIQQLFVPNEDGGVFRPAINYASLLFTNYSASLLGSGGSGNGTSEEPPPPGVGDVLVGWFLGRAADQTPQFVGAGVWLLITLIALVCAFVLTIRWRPEEGKGGCGLWRRLRRRLPRVRLSRRQAAYAASPSPPPPRMSPSTSSLNSLLSRSFLAQRRERRLAFRLLVLTAAFVVCTATLGVYWRYSGYGFGRMFQPQQGSRGGGGGGGGGSLSGAVNSAVAQLNTFIEDTLVRTNSSVLATCYEAFPGILDLFNRMAGQYLDLLSVDFKLTPLMNTFDRFLGLVKLLLASMNWIKNSRDSVLSPLNSFTTVINRTREDIRSQVSDVCAGSPGNGVPTELCGGVMQHLNQLNIGLDSRRIDSDSSVTIVTLLDKIFKLNVTEVEAQVNSAKSLLTNSLSLISTQITTLFNSLVSQVSGLFASALSGADDLRSSMLNATQSDAFVGIFTTADAVLQALTALIVITYCLMLALITVMLGLLVYFYYHKQQWETLRDNRQMGGDGPPADVGEGPPMGWQQQQQQQRPPLRSFTSIMESSQEELHARQGQLRTKETRHMLRMEAGMQCMCTGPIVRVMFALGVCFALIFLFGFALLYAGSEIQMDVCRYVATDSGTAVVDGMLDTMMDRDLWPMAQTALATKVNIPLPLTKSMLPKGLLRVLLHDCRNSSATFFQIYNLVNAFNVSSLLQAKDIQAELYKGKDMVNEMVGGLNASTLIPPEVDSILAVLPDFAGIIDTQDFSASIAELGKPLLTLGDRVPQLIGELLAMVRILSDRNPSDSRAVLIRHFAENLNTTYLVDYPALASKLDQMRQQFVTLQTNRIVRNLTFELTVNLAQLKLGLANKTALISAVATRYDQVLAAYLPEMAQVLNRLLSIILTRVGQCDGIAATLGVIVGECDSSLASLPFGGFYVALSSALLVLLCAGAMPVMRAARRHKRSAADQLRQSTGTQLPELSDSSRGSGDSGRGSDCSGGHGSPGDGNRNHYDNMTV